MVSPRFTWRPISMPGRRCLGAGIEEQSSYGTTPLHYAARNDARETAQPLLQQGANIEAKDNDDGTTLLHYTANQDARETAQLLLQQGANIEAKNNNGSTPLHYAASDNARETVQLLKQLRDLTKSEATKGEPQQARKR